MIDRGIPQVEENSPESYLEDLIAEEQSGLIREAFEVGGEEGKKLYDKAVRVREPIVEIDDDEKVINDFVSSISTRKQMVAVYHDYSNPDWIINNTPEFVLSMATALSKLACTFDLPTNTLWEEYNLTVK